MDGVPPVFILIIIVVIALVIFASIMSHKRRREFLAWAAARGLSVDTSHDHSMDERFPELDCLRQGDDRYAYDILTGNWKERPLLGFNYHYETYSKDKDGHTQTHHHHFSVMSLASEVPLRPLSIRPENFFDKLGTFFGAEDINFESAQFSRTFWVKSPDRKWAYDVIHARMMEYLLEKPRFSIQMHGDRIFAFRSSTFAIKDWEDAGYLLDGILDRLPDYLKRQQLGVNS
jgi:hypothetical protein